MPSLNNLRQTAKRARRVNTPPEPLSLDNLIIPAEFRNSLGDAEFLREIVVGAGKILLFVTDENLRILSEAEFWLCDGTFKTVPHIMMQLYTIHCPSGRYNNNSSCLRINVI